MTTRECKLCRKALPADHFVRDASRSNGRRPHCRKCYARLQRQRRADMPAEKVERLREASRQWRLANPEKSAASVRNATLKKKYGLTAAEVDAMFAAQGSCCLICKGTESRGNGRFHVDHDHVTGKVRGLLCKACNTTLGHMNESPDLLRAAADYLERTRC